MLKFRQLILEVENGVLVVYDKRDEVENSCGRIELEELLLGDLELLLQKLIVILL